MCRLKHNTGVGEQANLRSAAIRMSVYFVTAAGHMARFGWLQMPMVAGAEVRQAVRRP